MTVNPEDRRRDETSTAIQKVGAAIVVDQKVLVVKKRSQPTGEYYMAGGRMEAGETQRDTLVRELDEELQVKVRSFEYLGSFEDIAVFEQDPIVIHAYYVETDSLPSISSEIREYRWIDRNFVAEGGQLSSIMAEQVIPELVRLGKM